MVRWLKRLGDAIAAEGWRQVYVLSARVVELEEELETAREAHDAEHARRTTLESAGAELRRAFECATDRSEMQEVDFRAKWGADADDRAMLDRALAAFDVEPRVFAVLTEARP